MDNHDELATTDDVGNYSSIENYGIIGAMRTCALINKKNASLDFMCYPDFDSPSLFCRLLDLRNGGSWHFDLTKEWEGEEEDGHWKEISKNRNNSNISIMSINTLPNITQKNIVKFRQIYLPHSNILVTRFHAPATISQVMDLMPVVSSHLQRFLRVPFTDEDQEETGTKLTTRRGSQRYIRESEIPVPWIIRKFEVIRGTVQLRMTCRPHFDYARQSHSLLLRRGSDLSNFANEIVRCAGANSVDRNSKISLQKVSACIFRCDAVGKVMELTWSSSQPARLLALHMKGKGSNWPGIIADFELSEGEILLFLMREIPTDLNILKSPSCVPSCYKMMLDIPLSLENLEGLIDQTIEYWRSWLRKCEYEGIHRSWVYRSALLLKLMTYYPTGAIIAAPTFSLPEELGGKLNWDYRFTWIRDASFTIYAFIRLGLKDEANSFMKWIEDRCKDMYEQKSDLAILYDIRGNGPDYMVSNYLNTTPLNSPVKSPGLEFIDSTSVYEQTSPEEAFLTHLEGYCDSKPIRIGNGAVHQLQLDIYGELLDSIYLIDKHCQQISYDFWLFIKDLLIPIVLRRWKEPDYSIWEFRHGKQHYTYSKIMCWVAIDRALRLASKHAFPAPDHLLWQKIRDEIYFEVMEKGYDPLRKVFTQYYGSHELDASTLIMPLVFFMPANDPRFRNTLRAIMKKPKDGGLVLNHLCFRTSQPAEAPSSDASSVDASYLKNEGTFNLCTFWLIETLCRTGDPELIKMAELMFEGITSFANHLGLFSEELNISGKATGNFPQAFTHLSLISAAISMDRAFQKLS